MGRTTMQKKVGTGHGSDLIDVTAGSSGIEWLLSHFDDGDFQRSIAGLLQWLDDMKASNHIFQKRIGLNTLADWSPDGDGMLSHKEGRFFRIIGIRVLSEAREVPAWSQPIVDNVGTGIIGLLVKQEQGTTSFLMQAKAEVGNRPVVQLAPTVQFTQENYTQSKKLRKPFLFDEFNTPRAFPVLRESRQSEEGARFYKEQHVHRVLQLPERHVLDLPLDYRWLTANQLRFFLHCGEQVNSCARSILSCML